MASKKKYLTYIEDTKKHHGVLETIAKSSTKKAIVDSHTKSVAITIMEGEEIVKIGPKGSRLVIGKVENNRRKVKVGAKKKLS